jgi:hypothetical protein
MVNPLPTPRVLLTSLVDALTHYSPPHPQNESLNPHSNPLKILPASHKALLTTLHVLFPPPTLLQALDLLDRGLVTQVVQKPDTEASEAATERELRPPQAHVHLTSAFEHHGIAEISQKSEYQRRGKNSLFLVRSSQPPKSRFKDPIASNSTIYTVRVGAWNCSCAAFAFSAFPGTGGNFVANLDAEEPWDGGQEMDEDEKWEAGGVSFDGRCGGNVPVCKHLLACMLGDRWKGVLGQHMKLREVGKEEMAGFGAEG